MTEQSYGAWINPLGKIINVPERLGHSRHCPYEEAHREGWIAIVNVGGCTDLTGPVPRVYGMCLRLSPYYVTSPALRTAMKMVAQSGEDEFYFSNMFTNSFEGHFRSKNRRDAQIFLRSIMDGTSELLDPDEDH